MIEFHFRPPAAPWGIHGAPDWYDEHTVMCAWGCGCSYVLPKAEFRKKCRCPHWNYCRRHAMTGSVCLPEGA